MTGAGAPHTLALPDGATVLGFEPGTSTAIVGAEATGLLAEVEGPGRRALVLADRADALHGGLGIGAQIAAALTGTRRAALDRATDLLEQAGVPDPHDRVGAYPHQLSALDRQRAQLALALANQPELLLAEDPGAGLGAADAAALSASLGRLQARLGFTLLIGAPGLDSVLRFVEEIIVLEAGRVRERRRRRPAAQSSSSSPSSSA